MDLKCNQCGICCKLFMINLTESEYKSGNFKTQFESFGITNDFIEAEMTGENIIIQKKDGSCFYQKDGKCNIHSKRPDSCKAFFCRSKNPKFKDMKEKIDNYRNTHRV